MAECYDCGSPDVRLEVSDTDPLSGYVGERSYCAACAVRHDYLSPNEAFGPEDEDYERAAARARGNDFAETDGKDWT